MSCDYCKPDTKMPCLCCGAPVLCETPQTTGYDAETFPLSHEGCTAFWDHWKENGESDKHGFYESTWGAVRAYLRKAEETENQRAS
jgi:hypothetical protein